MNFGNPEKPEIGWQLAQAIEGIAGAAEALGIPVVSGNVSLYNETDDRAIPPTPVVGCIGLVPDVRTIPGRWNKGDRLFLASSGEGGLDGEAALVRFLWQSAPFLSLAHDVGRGGLEAAIAEAAIWSGLGAAVGLPRQAPAGGAAVIACTRADARRLSFPHLVELGEVDGRPLLGYDLSELEKAFGSMCGVFGIYAPDRDVARLTHFGLHALQHRGQESAGIAVSDRGRLTVLRELGLVSQVFTEEKLRGLHGTLAIGHTRYSTTGSSAWANAQPLVHHGRTRTIALGHNGNLVNAGELRDALLAEGTRVASTSDSELIAALIASDPAPLEEAVTSAMQRLEGAYSITALSEGKLLAFRDPHGFRPLCLGRLGEDWVVASETCALDLLGAELEREVQPGELVVIDDQGLDSRQAVAGVEHGAQCIFELFYLARPDSHLAGVEVHGGRVRMGERLAAEAPVDADLILPIPDSGTPAAIGFARASGIPFSEGLVKNRYVGRTFIQPDQALREQGIRLKYNPLDEVAGKRVVAVDDSIVRGNTTRQLVTMLFEAGATRGARAHLLAADHRALLLRHRLRGRGRADRVLALGRAGARLHRSHLARLPVAGGADRSHQAPRLFALPRLPDRRLSHASARSPPAGEAQVRDHACVRVRPRGSRPRRSPA